MTNDVNDVNAVNNSGTIRVYLREAGLMSKYDAFCQTRDEEACIHTCKIMRSHSHTKHDRPPQMQRFYRRNNFRIK